MKKTYIAPESIVHEIELQKNILAGSIQTDGEGNVQSVGVGNDNYDPEKGDIL